MLSSDDSSVVNLLDLHQLVTRKDQFHESIVIMMTTEQTPSLKVTNGHS